MPLTFLSHQGPALIIKRRWPQRFDGVALVTGSMAPDLVYVLNGSAIEFNAHVWPGWLLGAVPTAIAAAWFIRWVAAAAFPQLFPIAGTDWRRFAALSHWRPPWRATVAGAIAGVATHIFWDGFTHTARWGAQLVPWLAEGSVAGYPPAKILQYLSHVGGALLLLWLIRSEPLRALPEEPTARSRVFFWFLVLGGAAVGLVFGTDAFFAGHVIKTAFGAAAGLAVYRLLVFGRPHLGRTRVASIVPAKHD